MKNLLFVAVTFFSLSFFNIQNSNAQVPCGGGIIGIGPIGIGVVVDCPPPPPPPRVIVIRRVVRPVVRYAPVPVAVQPTCVETNSCQPVPRAPVSVPAAPADISRASESLPMLSVGAFIDSSSYEDGGLAGGGVNVKYLFSPHFGIELSTSFLSSCTNCNEFASREDTRVGLSALYYLGGAKVRGLNLYLKGGFVVNSIRFTDERNGDNSSVEQTNFEFGGGLELKLSRSLSLNVEATGMVAGETDESIGTKPIPSHMSKGIPSSDNSSGAFNFRAGINFHF
ncbi:porin family protein [Myxococcota bacterium]|nr:porin family protein [Myxococcota bacterium]MBU1381267.1 porin family protein [Myxococcota bacterium]MBU1498272.1 porin family protein [Myxococcota bacterium]